MNAAIDCRSCLECLPAIRYLLEMSLPNHFNTQLLNELKKRALSDTILAKALEYSLLAPGKRLRPTFAFESAALAGLSTKNIEPLAYAIEMIHIFSLVHDDLPCLDNDDTRRGIPTTHKKFSEAQALLAGDALLSTAADTFNELCTQASPTAFLEASRFFWNCVGAQGMIAGQSLELETKSPDRAMLEKIQAMKTTALFRAAILTPLLLAGRSKNDPLFLECSEYANAFGFAFQIADDLDDEAQDSASGAKNILSLYGREEAKKIASERLLALRVSNHFSANAILLARLGSSYPL